MSLFKISKLAFGNQCKLVLENSSSGEFLSILPETGGLLHELQYLYGDKRISVLDHYENEKELLDDVGNSFKGCNLFPFTNRIKDGQYNFGGFLHQLKTNYANENNAAHGLVYDRPFKIHQSKINNNSAQVVLEYTSDGSDIGYPFKYDLKVYYTLDIHSNITIKTQIKNKDNKAMPVSHGWHPYFQLEANIDQLELCFSAGKKCVVDERKLATGEFTTNKDFLISQSINKMNLDDCFMFSKSEKIAQTKLLNPNTGIGICIWQQQGKNLYNFLQVYTPEHRKSIAIEPSSTISNAFNHESNYLILKAGEEIDFTWGIKKLKL